MKIKQATLINELLETVSVQISKMEEWKKLPQEKLTFKPQADKWNVLECVEHLNLYTAFYLPEIQLKLSKSTKKQGSTFESGWLGNYFANSMLPKEKLNAMNTFKDKNPLNQNLNGHEVLEHFIAEQKQLKKLLEKAKDYDLNKVRTSITIKFITLRLGDTFRFLINHQVRHFQQIERLLG
jgi:uncharacterized damage-inducible protein DinB